jgi:ribose transport system substrate-binding protein
MIFNIGELRSRLVLAVVLAALAVCGRGRDNRIEVLVCPKGLTQNFWLTVRAGADSAGRELGTNVIWKGPAVETDIAGQIAIVEDYINKRVDGIVLAACDTRALIPVVERAGEAGIPVVTIDSGLDSDVPLSFVATDNVLAAKKAAEILAELIGERGEVACIPFIAGAATSIWRESGFKEGLKKYPDITLAAVQYSQADVATAMAVTEDMLTSHPNLKGIFAASEAGAIGAARALAARKAAGRVKLVAFDASPNEIEFLQTDLIQALIVQDPFAMGYRGVESVVRASRGIELPRRIDTGITVATMMNFSEPQVRRVLFPLGEK